MFFDLSRTLFGSSCHLAGVLRAKPNTTLRASVSASALLIATTIVAQLGSISGTVLNQDGDPLPFTSITLDPAHRVMISDTKGAFHFDDLAAGTYTLSSSYVGYVQQTSTVEVHDDRATIADQRMKESVVDLEAFTVLGSLTKGSGPSRTMAGSAWYVGPREIQAQAATDVHRLLRSVPGVYIQEEDGFGLRPNIGLRGAGSERSSKITLMEDGVLIAPAPYAQPAAYYFPTIGRMHAVEIVKGSSQIRYGPLTTGGALNMISTPLPTVDQAMLGIWGGSFGARNLHASAGTTIGKHQVMAETFQQASDGFKRLDNGGNTGFTKQDYLLKWQWSTSDTTRTRHAIGVKTGYTTESSNETYLGLTSADYDTEPYRRYSASAKDHMEVKHDLSSLRYAVGFKKGPEIAATLYRTNTFRNWYKLDQVVDSAGSKIPIGELLADPSAHTDALNVVRGSSSSDNALLVKANNRNYQSSGAQMILTHTIRNPRATHGIEIGARLHSDYMDRYQWTDGWRMTNGAMFQTSKGTPGTESNRIAKADAIAAHAVYDLDLGGIALHPGLRFEHIEMKQDDYGKLDPGRSGTALVTTSNTVDVWIPGIGADWSINKTISFFTGVHKGFSPPGTQPGTLPEASINYEAGLRYERAGYNIQLIGYLNDYSRMLGTDLAAGGGSGTGDLFNAGAAVVKGVEFFASFDPLRGRSAMVRLPVSVAYTYTDARFSSDFNSSFEPWGDVLKGDRIPYTPEHQINARVGMETGKIMLGLNAHYQSMVTTVTGPQSDVGTMKIDPRTVFDANASYRVGAGTELFATVVNLTDVVYEASRLPAGSRPGLPRSFQVGLRLRL